MMSLEYIFQNLKRLVKSKQHSFCYHPIQQRLKQHVIVSYNFSSVDWSWCWKWNSDPLLSVPATLLLPLPHMVCGYHFNKENSHIGSLIRFFI